ncbi:unnamed protein product [Mytilus edulis]|uniref:Tyr recombinase domain-containing protein n=1 Tax=Mytilus edulis TaxID=6550 RepID=A0A8S3V611_MYTED|nr:unnamed protein product [Mytilus edulis]
MLRNLLHSLGFLVNKEKSVFIPTQRIIFLGYLIDSVQFKVFLTEEKIQKILKSANKIYSLYNPVIREVSSLIGLFTSASCAVLLAPIFHRYLDIEKTLALSKNNDNYDGIMSLSENSRNEILWWIKNVDRNEGKSISFGTPTEYIETDASKIGWGAVYGKNKTQGRWMKSESISHINILELLAIKYAFFSLGKNISNSHICIKSDSSTAVQYINNMGGSVVALLEVYHSKNFEQGRRGTGENGFNDSSNMAIPTLVSKIIELFGRLSCYSPFLSRSFKTCTQQSKAPAKHEKVIPSRLCSIRHSLQKKGISKSARNIITQSWRVSTSRQYEYSWRKWYLWCNTQKINTTSPNEVQVLNFLARLYDDGKSYSCINMNKCSIGQTLASIGCNTVINSNLISRFMKGIFNARPPLPKYSITWDVGKVVRYLETLFPLESLSLKMLTLKIATLLALTTAQRAQTLTNLNLNYMETSSKTVVFTMNCLQKTDRIGRINQNITLDTYKKKELCPVYTLKYYLKATKKLRKDDYLLVSFRTWRKISTSTLARWLKIVLTSSGIDVTKFQAHSFRGASTSAAFSAGITLDIIMKTANWKSAKTFKKFYLREVEAKRGVKTGKKKFINAVLSV